MGWGLFGGAKSHSYDSGSDEERALIPCLRLLFCGRDVVERAGGFAARSFVVAAVALVIAQVAGVFVGERYCRDNSEGCFSAGDRAAKQIAPISLWCFSHFRKCNRKIVLSPRPIDGVGLASVDSQRGLVGIDGLTEIVSFIARGHLIPCYAEIVLGSRPLDGVSLPVADGKRGLIGGDGLVEIVGFVARSHILPCYAEIILGHRPIDGVGLAGVNGEGGLVSGDGLAEIVGFVARGHV